MTDIHAAVAQVSDAESFGFFVRALRRQVDQNAQAGPFQAENFDLGSVLVSLDQWRETPSAAQIDRMNPWAAAAKILLVGHYHE
ncbi:MAG: hypothetical protein AAGK00_08005 [Pseudomonadota bacterium]